MTRYQSNGRHNQKQPSGEFHIGDSNSALTAEEVRTSAGATASPFFRGTTKPYIRWWWLTGPFREQDIARQLRWVREAGFGGVELAWIFPSWLEDDDSAQRPEWLGPRWSELVLFAKQTAEELELGCDFTFGSCWPFGGSWISPEDASQTLTGASEQRLECSWEQPLNEAVAVLNHLSEAALRRYARPLLNALRPALQGSLSALFCDSLELQTENVWSPELWETFEGRFGYSLRPFAAELDQHPHVRYDYRKLIGDTIRREFYGAFNQLCRENQTYARVQCHGAPTDLLAAYASVDVPESESLLFPPTFSRIAASAAAWAGKPVVSAEAFTCIYGFPGWDDDAETYWRQEDLADLKLLADGLFAQGVNQIVWHGMPYQPAGKEVEFYASVHVGADSTWAGQLPAFNKYLEDISALMQLGQTYGGLGVYLPFEDALMENLIAKDERTPGANYRWEMRHAVPPPMTEGFHPLWISEDFLNEARVENGYIRSRALQIDGVYVDCNWLEERALMELLRLADEGAWIACARRPGQPGLSRRPKSGYERNVEKLISLGQTWTGQNRFTPLLTGDDLPWYWARSLGDQLLLFLAHPIAKTIRYPMQRGLGRRAVEEQRQVVVRWRGRESILHVTFEPRESLLLLVDKQGVIAQVKANEFRPQSALL